MIGPIVIGMALCTFALHALGMSWVRAVAAVVGIVAATVVLTLAVGALIRVI